MSIVGVTASKDYLYLAMTTGPKAQFAVGQYHRIPVDPNDWPSLVATLMTHLSSYDSKEAIEQVAVACCASGMYGASPELSCQECGYPITVVTKKGFAKHIGCQPGQKWQAFARQRFNAQKQITYFTSGYDAAISAAYGVAP